MTYMKHIIKDEELMDYLDGNLNASERASLKRRLKENGELDLLYHAMLAQKAMMEALDDEEALMLGSVTHYPVAKEIPINFNHNGKKGSTILVLDPMRLAAAKTDGYLCDIECEEYILLSMGYDVTKKSLLDEAYLNKWMKEKGMPIYHIGRLLEKNHLAVARRYNASLDDLTALLEQGNKVIAVVNAQKLSILPTPQTTERPTPDHAVVVLEVSKEDNIVKLFDPQTGNDADIFTVEAFAEAWADSQNFMVVANEQDRFVYDPQPIDVNDADLSPELLELGEAIAENAHEIWALKRKSEGWNWGPERNDRLLQTPDMAPYSNLSEEEKDYDRQMAMQTLKLVQKLGYRIVKDF